jgi:hypothetical protein
VASGDRLFATRWVHVFEEDTPDGDVYRPEDADIPLSRRPRERIALHKDGSASVFSGGADDRLAEQTATWRKNDDGIVVRTSDGAEIRIVDQSADRLVVKVRRGDRGR